MVPRTPFRLPARCQAQPSPGEQHASRPIPIQAEKKEAMPSHEDVHYCPSCELRFAYRTELEDHILHDHPAQADLVQGHDPYHREQSAAHDDPPTQ